jgi:hypothetical protein
MYARPAMTTDCQKVKNTKPHTRRKEGRKEARNSQGQKGEGKKVRGKGRQTNSFDTNKLEKRSDFLCFFVCCMIK